MKQLDPKSVWLFFLSSVFRWFIFCIFFSIWGAGFFGIIGSVINSSGESSFSPLNLLWIIIPIFFILCFVWAKLSYKFYKYELADIGFRKESGVIYKRYVTIPYDRIQNVDIYRGITARILGLSDLHIQTAGVGVAIGEGRLPGLSIEVAEQLRDELIQRARQSKNQGL